MEYCYTSSNLYLHSARFLQRIQTLENLPSFIIVVMPRCLPLLLAFSWIAMRPQCTGWAFNPPPHLRLIKKERRPGRIQDKQRQSDTLCPFFRTTYPLKPSLFVPSFLPECFRPLKKSNRQLVCACARVEARPPLPPPENPPLCPSFSPILDLLLRSQVECLGL